MRVAFINQPWAVPLPPSESISIWTHEVGRRLAQRPGVEVVVYARGDRPHERVRQASGMEHRFISAVNDWRVARVLEPLFRRAARPFFASSLFHLGYALGVARDLRRRPCDVVHVHNFSQWVPLLARACPRSRIVLHMHCEWLSQLPRDRVARRLRRAGLVLGCSDHVTDRARQALPGLSGRMRTIYYGVDVDRFRPGPPVGVPRILFVSRVSPEKGVHVLIGAFAEVAAGRPGATLEVVGPDAPVPPEMLVGLSADPAVAGLARFYDGDGYAAALRAGAGEGVTFTGSLDHDAVAERYRSAAVVACPSFSEAFGMAVTEAMASGVPVVASRVGGMVESVRDGETGLLVDAGDTDGLADALLLLLSDDGMRARMGAAARQRAEGRFAWERITDRLALLYAEVLA